jgi:hypothetical protein
MAEKNQQERLFLFTKAREEWKQRNIDAELNLIEKQFSRGTPEYLYEYIYSRNSWIYKTIIDKGLKNNLEQSQKVVLVGSGMYPYSLFDMFKRFPDKSYFGIEISPQKTKLAELITSKTPAKDHITFYTDNAFTFDYSEFSEDDMIFISCDVDSKPTIEQIVKTSGAQFWICAPYEKIWVKNLLSK